MTKTPISFSLDPELASWASENSKDLGFPNRSVMVERLLQALRENKIVVLDPPDPFPSQRKTRPGSSENPILVSFE